MNTPETLLVEALRSGKYKQRKYQLGAEEVDGASYCCLGVACEVAIEQGALPESSKIIRTGSGGIKNFRYNESETGLPDVVKTWLGWRDNSGCLRTLNDSLLAMNDAGRSFKEIADCIERGEVLKKGEHRAFKVESCPA